MDRWFKRIWLVNGVLVFLALLVALVMYIGETQKSRARRNRPQAGPQVAPIVKDRPITQDVSLSLPARVGTTDLVYVEIGVKDLAHKKSLTLGMESSEAVNLLFCNADGTSPRLLLDRKAFILGIDIPSVRDSLQEFNLYGIVFEDTDGDRRLTAKDGYSLYISDLDGTNLVPVLPEGVDCTRYHFNPNARELVMITRLSKKGAVPAGDQPEEILVFDLSTRKLRQFLEGNESIERARRILWDK